MSAGRRRLQTGRIHGHFVADGRQITEGLNTTSKSQARRLALEIQQRVERGEERVPESTITVDVLADRYFESVKARDVAPKTEWKYRADLAKLRQYCGEAGIRLARRFSTEDFFGFRQWLVEKGYAAKTVQGALVLAKQVFK